MNTAAITSVLLTVKILRIKSYNVSIKHYETSDRPSRTTSLKNLRENVS